MTMKKIDIAAIEAAPRGECRRCVRSTGAVFQSLDGVMQAPGGPSEDSTNGFTHGGWQMGYWDEVADTPSANC